MLNKQLLFAFCTLIVASSAFLVNSRESGSRSVFYRVSAKQFRTEGEFVTHAITAIKEQLQQKTGNPERISCTYKLAGKKAVSAVVKTHYVDYRKKPDCCAYNFSHRAELTPDRSLEIIYHLNDKHHLALVTKDLKKHKRLDSKSIDIADKMMTL